MVYFKSSSNIGDLIDGEEDFLVRWEELCSSGDIVVGGETL
uniref:Uncharacterized protein n=1 Tax=viral metagenome TaxID=1070528 RepID=A0A6C0CWH6_9ZZZZ